MPTMLPRPGTGARLDGMKAVLGSLVLAVVLLPAAASADEVRGTPHRDYLRAGPGGDLVRGLAGNDTLIGSRGDDELRGGPGNDVLEDDRGDDVLVGGAGHDSLDGRSGNDVLIGGAGPDFVADYLGGDLIRTGRGDDWGSIDSRGERPHAPTVLHLGRGDDEILVGGPDGRRDVVDCGPGDDLAEWNLELDPQDVFVDCEVIREYEGS
jgi:Ca2+-binding RTX toxin-like protein